ncbi:SRPBCC family protein [Pelagicoccus sp. SDUM812003]|uniref:SRPBCC family protein n=1 Tax=Pelagicoccus sp. SDUM812003 TaxID=3041267 RepID=UPI00280EFE6D|nr:SRPBCC family protein [Pelagicoccus sp. SDUM812003]MDQ8203318.1 SRPBCC family protein [Pelagicoccus sp. SDUM812003]
MKIIGSTVEATLPFEREKVRRIVGAPALIVNWHPWVDQISIIEQQGLLYRKARLMGGETELIEKFWEVDGQDEFHFQAVQGLWADYRYRSKIRLEDAEGGRCKVVWQGRLMKKDEEDEKEQMDQFYESGLAGLEELLADL